MASISDDPDLRAISRRLNKLEVLLFALVASEAPAEDGEYPNMVDLLQWAREDGESVDRDHRFYQWLEYIARWAQRKETERIATHDLSARIEALRNEFLEASEASRYQIFDWTDKFGPRLERLYGDISELQDQLTETSQVLHHNLMFQYLGRESESVALNRFIPVRVYLSENGPADAARVAHSMTGLLRVIGFEISDDFPAEVGSWRKKWYAKSKDALSQDEVTDRLKKVERAVEVTGLHKPQAEVDKAEAEAIAALTASLKDIPKAAIQAGSILLVKVTDEDGNPSIQARTLTTKEMIHLENNQHLLCKPELVMQSLSDGTPQTHLPPP